MNKRLNEKYLTQIKELKQKYGYDPEKTHEIADNILCELLEKLGYTELVLEFNCLDKWYG